MRVRLPPLPVYMLLKKLKIFITHSIKSSFLFINSKLTLIVTLIKWVSTIFFCLNRWVVFRVGGIKFLNDLILLKRGHVRGDMEILKLYLKLISKSPSTLWCYHALSYVLAIGYVLISGGLLLEILDQLTLPFIVPGELTVVGPQYNLEDFPRVDLPTDVEDTSIKKKELPVEKYLSNKTFIVLGVALIVIVCFAPLNTIINF
jgi:hypothetical protein